MGSGVMNAIADAHGREDRDLAARIVSSGILMLTGIALVLAVLFSISYPFVPWERVFNVKTPTAIQEAGPAVAVFVGCFLLSFPLGLVHRIQGGYQEGFASSVWSAISVLISLAALLIVVKLQAGLPWLVLGFSGAPLLVWLLASLYVMGIQRPWLMPRLSRFNMTTARRLLRVGTLFLILQIAVTLAIFCDNMVTTQVLGASRVTEYNIAQRLFALPYMMVAMLLGGLWPAYGEAQARGDIDWIKRTLKRSMATSMALIVPASLFLATFHKPIIKLWIRKDASTVMPSFWLIVGFAIWNVMSTCGMTLSLFFNGLQIMRFQVLTAVPMAIVNLAISIILAKTWGLPGVIWGTVISYAAIVVIPSLWYVPRLLKRMTIAPQQAPATASAEMTTTSLGGQSTSL
jgi:O-antigen/teichoic acid export membrane protein